MRRAIAEMGSPSIFVDTYGAGRASIPAARQQTLAGPHSREVLLPAPFDRRISASSECISTTRAKSGSRRRPKRSVSRDLTLAIDASLGAAPFLPGSETLAARNADVGCTSLPRSGAPFP